MSTPGIWRSDDALTADGFAFAGLQRQAAFGKASATLRGVQTAMDIPYESAEVDDLLRACIEFTDEHELLFAASNIAGRQGVVGDQDSVSRMMEWLVEFDRGLLEYKGLGKHNIGYFQIGHRARMTMARGGFAAFVRRKQADALLRQVKGWAPIAVSLLALVVAFLAWYVPQGSSTKLDDVSAQVAKLQVRLDEGRSASEAMQKKLDAIVGPDHGAEPPRKGPRAGDKR